MSSSTSGKKHLTSWERQFQKLLIEFERAGGNLADTFPKHSDPKLHYEVFGHVPPKIPTIDETKPYSTRQAENTSRINTMQQKMKGQIELHDAHREVKKRIDDMQPMPDGEETTPSFNRATNVWIDNMYEYEKSEDILRALQKQKNDLDREEKEMKNNNNDN